MSKNNDLQTSAIIAVIVIVVLVVLAGAFNITSSFCTGISVAIGFIAFLASYLMLSGALGHSK